MNASDSPLLTNFKGKILRINFDGTVPTDNPFYDGAGPNRDAIWAYGLRNPYRMSIDPVTGRMYIGDVGGNDPKTAIEELNLGVRGANYGWPAFEGVRGADGLTDPIFSYPHSGRDACITGGIVYRGSQFPGEYYGSYFYGDYVQNYIKRITFDANGNVANVSNFWPTDGSVDGTSVGDPVKFTQGPDGSLYYIDLGFNDQHVPNPAAIRRIRYVVSNPPPVAAASAVPTSGQPPLTVSFSSAGSSDPEGQSLRFNWTFGDGGSSTLANPTHMYSVAGQYIARVSVSDGSSSTLSPDVNVTVGTPPTVAITSPANGTTFVAGDSIVFNGTAADSLGIPLPTSAYTWRILFHHDNHIHPAGGSSNSTSTTIVIPTSGHDFQDQTHYEVLLTAVDGNGLSNFASVSVYPDKVNLSFDSSPSGLTLQIDGISKTTPFVLDDVKGFGTR